MRYSIWNKKDNIITPIGEVLTPEQWIERYPVAGLENITVICSAGEINGGFFGTLGQMVNNYQNQGADFSSCKTDEEKLAVIEAFDAEKQRVQREDSEAAILNETLRAESLASIAASLEYQNMLTLDDVEV